MRERIIWRPNSIPQEQWDKLSREAQIQWWEEESAKRPPFSIVKFLKTYDPEKMPPGDVEICVLRHLTEENCAEVLQACRPKLLASLHRWVGNQPADDDEVGWQSPTFVETASFVPGLTREEVDAAVAEGKRTFRRGVRVFRRMAPPLRS